jgi:hypothetical protein
MKVKMSGVSLNPNAWIVVNNQKDKSKPSDRGRKSIKKGKVYLQDGQEFEIEIFNPLKQCVLCDIKFNGSSISKTGLVLRPGQRFYLDCFLDDKKKFIFNTYEVENNDEAKEAISNNGLLEVFFYKEEVTKLNNWYEQFNRTIWYPHYDQYWFPSRPSVWYSTNVNGVLNSNLTNSSTSNLTDISTNISFNNTNSFNYHSNIQSYSDDSIQTGRVERGTASNQKFLELEMNFEKYYISNTVIQILPENTRPIETKEIKKKKSNNTNKSEIIEMIKKLSELHDAGILNDTEFNNKKKELLIRI